MSGQQTLEQKRAKAAWDAVSDVKGKGLKDYGPLARSAPADIQVNGLGQTLSFWRAKGKPEHLALYQHVSTWVMGQLKATHPNGLMGWIMAETTTSDQYRQATAEAMAFLMWLKRFAEAELGGG